MRRIVFFLSLFLLPPRALSYSTSEPPPLSQYVRDPAPWLSLKANSEQRQPVYLGSSPRELVLGKAKSEYPLLQHPLQTLGISHVRHIAATLKETNLEFEAWPVLEWQGRQTWAFARWRKTGTTQWIWLSDSILKKPLPGDQPQPILPRNLDPANAKQSNAIFADFLTLRDLYDKPVFGECIWTAKKDERITQAWLDPDLVSQARRDIKSYQSLLCRAIHQPARFNDAPRTFVLRLHDNQVLWPHEIRWQPARTADLATTEIQSEHVVPTITWPEDWHTHYAMDIEILSGQREAEYKNKNKQVRTKFVNKNSADPKNQLLDIVSYLEYRYDRLGIKTEREAFAWRDIPQVNLIAKIPGKHSADKVPPVVMADHIDTAFCEDIFQRSKAKSRISAPGADDNMAAAAALLQAAQRLAGQHLEREIWLYHLTGEEFPGDDLGARVATSHWLQRKQDITGIVLLDMIAYRKKNDPLFQINAGTSKESQRLAELAFSISLRNKGTYTPVLRPAVDARSYLYNTDGLIFADAGYPVVLFNEHINRLENLDRPHYHQSTDVTSTLDLDYAATIVRSAILTVAQLAAQRP
ncbi:MAG: M28 family peptidase [Myxococcales bacterium]|nr:M28 family peptidase [Myxococcales bacterium]